MRKFEEVLEPFKMTNNFEIKLPTRSDEGSAGYDFYSPIKVNIEPGQYISFPLDVKVSMEKDEVLLLYVRSSIGIKKHLVLCNGTGVIDSTYYNNKNNDGNILCALYNYGNEKQTIEIGDRIMQGVFVKYLTTDNDQPLNKERNGGIGSTGN